LFAEADAFVLPSLHDGWGVVVNQALGAGLPVIASDTVGAAGDLVRHGENGLIVPAGNVAALEVAIRTFAEGPDRCREMGKNATETADTISLHAGVNRWHEFLSEIVARKFNA